MITMRHLFIFLFFASALVLRAQDTYSDDFESYTAGAFVAKSNTTNWRTWTNTAGGAADDAKISTKQAASGSNSFVIRNTVSGGGPEDLILKIGGTRNKGTLDIGWKVYITRDSGAYWNFQGTATPGGSWAMDCQILPDGKLYITTGTLNTKTIPFPIGEWVDFRALIDITNNMFSIYINGQCEGVYRSQVNTVGGVDFFANVGSSYYVDDLFYNYSAEAPVYGATEAGLVGMTVEGGRQIEGEVIKLNTTLYNVGTDTITSVVYQITSGGGNFVDTLNTVLAPGKTLNWTIPNDVTLFDGDNNVSITLIEVNGGVDSFTCNNAMNATVFAVKPADHRKIILEEGTGTWCGWCPRGAVFLDQISPLYDEYIIPIAVHNNDPMTVAAYNSVITTFPGFTGFPGMVVDRREVWDPSQALQPALPFLREAPDAIISLGAKINDDPTKMDFSVKFNFLNDIPAGYKMFLTLSENDVKGDATTYNQANYYAGGASGPMGGYETLPNPVPFSQMVYQHVARSFNANNNLAAYTAGDSLVLNFTVAMEAKWNQDKMKVIGVLLKKDGKVSNANDATIDEAVKAGFILNAKERILTDAKLSVYPNPAFSTASVNMQLSQATPVSVSLLDIQGKTVFTQDFGNHQGETSLSLNLSQLTSGIYTVMVRTNSGVATQKLTVIK